MRKHALIALVGLALVSALLAGCDPAGSGGKMPEGGNNGPVPTASGNYPGGGSGGGSGAGGNGPSAPAPKK